MQEDEILEDDPEIDEIQELLESEDLDEEEDKPLTRSKILSLILIGFSLFVLFFLFLFPLDEVIKSYLIDFSKKSGIVLEFKDIHFPVLGAKRIDSLAIQPSSDTLVKSEELSLDTKILELIKYKFDGELSLAGFRFEKPDISFFIKSILITGKLAGWEDRISKYSGDLTISLRGGEIGSLPDLPLIGEVKKIGILQGQFRIKFRSGRLLIETGNLNTTWFRFQISGNIRLNDNMPFSGLDLKICASAQEKFASERPDIAGMLALLPQENGKSCIPILGTIRSPQVDMPSLMGGTPSGGVSGDGTGNNSETTSYSDNQIENNQSGSENKETQNTNSIQKSPVIKDGESQENTSDN